MSYYSGFNNGFMPPGATPLPYSGGYQPPTPLPNATPQMSASTAASGVVWVKGDREANSRYVAPGEHGVFFDANEPKFYIKSVDNFGVSNLQTFNYTPENAAPAAPTINTQQFVTREEYEKLRQDYENIIGRLDRLTAEQPKKTTRKAVSDDADTAV